MVVYLIAFISVETNKKKRTYQFGDLGYPSVGIAKQPCRTPWLRRAMLVDEREKKNGKTLA